MILLIEDNPGDVTLFQTALRDTPSHCTVGRSAEEAIALLAQGTAFNVVVVDLRLSGTDGWAVLEYLRAHPRPCAQVILTSSTNERDRARATALGSRHYWIKPDDFASLQRLVREISMLDAMSGAQP